MLKHKKLNRIPLPIFLWHFLLTPFAIARGSWESADMIYATWCVVYVFGVRVAAWRTG